MATFEGYITVAIGFVVWMVGYAILELVNAIVLPRAAELDSRGLMEDALNWTYHVQEFWILIGLIGFLLYLLAKGATTRGGV